MERRVHPLPCASIGQQRALVSLHFGAPGRRKIYLQASLHAEELPGMLVLHHLREALLQAEQDGLLAGEVVLVPLANPIGLSQRINHRPTGRFELDTAQNFNRHYPDLADAVFEQARARLGQDAEENIRTVRELVGRWLDDWQPASELDAQRRCLLRLAHDAEAVLDLHCDAEAALHMYTEAPCWPALEPLARLLGCEAILLARDSGGGPFDERLSGLWWQLAERLARAGMQVPLPQACASTTVELRGEADVSHDLARVDAQALIAYLAHIGMVRGQTSGLPALRCQPTPLAGSQTLRSPVPGLVAFRAAPGTRLRAGEAVADIIDPTSEGASRVHTVCTDVEGVFYARVRDRYVHAGGELGKVAGAVPFRHGDLLGA
ncbi:MAG: M14 family metallopeptidase [Burkholderiaceae bacterium]